MAELAYHDPAYRLSRGETTLMAPWRYCPDLWSHAGQGGTATIGRPSLFCFTFFGLPSRQLTGTKHVSTHQLCRQDQPMPGLKVLYGDSPSLCVSA